MFGADSFISRLYPAGRQAQAEGGARAHEIGFGCGFGALWGVGVGCLSSKRHCGGIFSLYEAVDDLETLTSRLQNLLKSFCYTVILLQILDALKTGRSAHRCGVAEAYEKRDASWYDLRRHQGVAKM